MKIGCSISKIRRLKGYGQSYFAETLSCSQSYLSKIESGLSSPNFGVISMLRSCHGVDINKIIDAENRELKKARSK